MIKLITHIIFFVMTVVVMLLAASCGQQVIVSASAPVLGVVIDADMHVLHVEAQSAAQQAGIQTGDIFKTFNGLALPEHSEQLREALITDPAETAEIEIGLIRDGQSVTVVVIPSAMVLQNVLQTPTPVLSPNDYL